MSPNKLNKILKNFFAFFFWASFAFAQEKPVLSEQNLPIKSAIASEKKDQEINLNDIKNSVLLDQAKGSLANILLGNKPVSLMFDDEENDDIERAIDSFKNNQIYTPKNQEVVETKDKEAEEKNEKSYIYLSAIMYFSSKDWVIWLNDQKITSKNNSSNNEIFVDSINKDQVKILWRISLSKWRIISGKNSTENVKTNSQNQVETIFTLKPNQTFVLDSNSVFEGKANFSASKKSEKEKEKPKHD
jgi:hypothetical protein